MTFQPIVCGTGVTVTVGVALAVPVGVPLGVLDGVADGVTVAAIVGEDNVLVGVATTVDEFGFGLAGPCCPQELKKRAPAPNNIIITKNFFMAPSWMHIYRRASRPCRTPPTFYHILLKIVNSYPLRRFLRPGIRGY
ncbi:MAG: hypothetical protein KGH93_01080 [Patescibacteria group bacterium]|nr:hypothetical protein [Patescibacteria group bacterium]MDE1945774.1 hypothetical protein [Patescibacteria group bacterium]